MTEQATLAPAAQSEAPAARGGWLAFAAVAYLIAMLSMLRQFIDSANADIALATAASSLTLFTLAAIVAGAAMGAWSTSRFPNLSGGTRYAVPVVAGVLTGAVAGAAVLLVRGMPTGAMWTLALILGLCGAVGGALSLLRPAAVVRAGTTATLTALVCFSVLQIFSSPLLRFFGADGTVAGNESANGYLRITQAMLMGILGGLFAFWVMRREGMTRWQLFLLAGGMPGLVWILGDVFTRLGTAKLLTLASNDALGDRIIQHSLGGGRIVTGMLLFFLGSITAIIALGRTMPKKADR